MPIFAKNISVGGSTPPTKPVEEIKSSFISAKNVTVKNKKQVQEIVKLPPVVVPPVVVQPVIEEKYIKKTDGDLIRHINKKSTYLRDMLEVSN
jgi:hypothetical protein